MENNGVVIPPVDPEMLVPAAPAAPQLHNSRPSQGSTKLIFEESYLSLTDRI